MKFCEFDKMSSFEYYNSKANSVLEDVASLMAHDFHEVWWKDERFKESRETYKEYGSMINKESPLKYEISKYLKDKKLDDSNQYYEEIDSLKKVEINGVITTNWDNLLKELFCECDVYIGQDGILNSDMQGLNEIYKIHGCVDDFNSLILTGNDYKNFNQRNAYLAAKLLTIFIEHPVFFIGYSISDKNIISILKQISECLSNTGLEKIKDNLFLIEPIFNENDDNNYIKTPLTIGDFSIPITNIKLKDYSVLYSELGNYKRKLSLKKLKLIKQSLVEIVRDNDPNNKLAALNMDKITDYNDIEFVLGVGVLNEFGEKGYGGIKEIEIFEDLINDNRKFDNKKIVETSLIDIFSRKSDCPIFKYLRLGGYYDSTNNLNEKVPDKIRKKVEKREKEYTDMSLISGKLNNIVKKKDTNYNYDYNWQLLISKIMIEGKNSVDIDRLYEFLLMKREEVILRHKNIVKLKKLIAIYDWLKYS